MEVFVARHPIFDLQNQLYGYDLEFRAGFESLYRLISERDQADAQVAVSFQELAGHGKAHILFPPELVARELPAVFPRELLTVGLPAGAAVEEELLAACRRLSRAGYELALDGLAPEHLDGPLVEMAQIARFDARAMPLDQQRQVCRTLGARGKRLLAKRVDTAELLQTARDLGCCYFQGDFFRRPVLRPGKDVPTSKLQYLRVLNEVHKLELAYDELEGLIKRDVAMTYKLLRFINSAWYGLKTEVRSIRHALVLLGPAEVRVWASLLVLRDMGQDKPPELFRQSLTRARVAEHLAPKIGIPRRASELFLMGMFSLVDALTDLPMGQILDGLPLTRSIKDALLHHTGELAPVCDTIVAYQTGDWESLGDSAAAACIDENVLPAMFLEAARWTDQALSVL